MSENAQAADQFVSVKVQPRSEAVTKFLAPFRPAPLPAGIRRVSRLGDLVSYVDEETGQEIDAVEFSDKPGKLTEMLIRWQRRLRADREIEADLAGKDRAPSPPAASVEPVLLELMDVEELRTFAQGKGILLGRAKSEEAMRRVIVRGIAKQRKNKD